MSEQGIERRGDPAFLRRVASDMRHDRNLKGAIELETIAARLEALATPPVPAGEVGELIERLRAKVGYVTEEADGAEHVTISAHVDPDCDKAAALLESLQADVERLREVLEDLAEGDYSSRYVMETARAALSSPSSLR